LNVTNAAVTAELKNSAIWWLDQGVDRFRLDAAKHLIEQGSQYESTPQTLKWLATFQRKLAAHKPDVMTIAEVWSPTSSVSQYVPAAADVAFDFDLAKALTRTARDQNEVDLLVELDIASRSFPKGQYASFLSNHDQPRIATAVGADPGSPNADVKLKQAASLLIAAQRNEPSSIWNHYRSLIELKRSLPALSGSYQKLSTPINGAAAWFRSSTSQTLVIIHNVTDRPLRVPLSSTNGIVKGKAVVRFGLPTSTAVSEPNPDAQGAVTGWTPIEKIPPRTSVVLELGK
jgi:glycosidase